MGQKITNFDSNWAFLDCNTSLNSLMAMKWCTCKAWRSVEEVPYNFLRSSIKFEDHPGPENCQFESNLINITRPVTPIKSLRLACFFKLRPSSSMNGSVHPSVCPSQLFRCLCHRIIMKFSEVIIIDKSDVHAKSQGQRSKGKVKELKRTFNQIWAFLDQNSSSDLTDGYEITWNYAQSLKCHRRRALFKVILEISRSHRT